MPRPVVVARRLSWLLATGVLSLPLVTPGSPVSLVPVALEQPQQLSISGSVDNLREGLPAQLTLTLHNSSDASAAVHSLTVRVAGATVGCPRSSLSVSAWSGTMNVPPRGSAQAAVRVVLRDPAGRCTGATWQLAYTSA